MPQLASFCLFSSFLLFLFMLVKYRKNTQRQVLKPPPGPTKLPIIGNLHQLIGPLPHHSLTELAKKYGPIMSIQMGEVKAVVISSPEIAKEVLKTHELSFAQRPAVVAAEIMAYESIVFAPYNDYWRQLRKISVLELLSAKRVQSFRSIREDEVWNMVESISSSEGQPINLSKVIFSMTNNVVSRAAFGRKCKDQGDFVSLLAEIVLFVGGFNMPDLFPSLRFLSYINGMKPALKKIQKKIDKILDDILTEHKIKRQPFTGSNNIKPYHEENLLDVLLNIQESNEQEFQLTTEQIKAVSMDVFSAGSETSATTMEWVISELIRNPTVMEKAQAEVRKVFDGKRKIEETDIQKLDYLKSVIKETLRFHPPAPIIPRESRQRCEIKGYEIPVKAKILINAWAIGRDQKYWTEPECFKPERFQNSSIDFKGTNFELIPFGAGRRICPGISFATANIELALAQLLYHFDWTLPNGIKPEELDMTENFGITSRKKHNLHLIATIGVPFLS